MLELLSRKSASEHTILVVDDEPDIVEELTTCLAANGFRMLQASGGKAALEIVIGEHPDLLVTDLRMLRGDGHELIAKVNSLPFPRPIIFCMTAYADINASTAFERGIDLFLPKPFALDLVVNAAHHFLRVRREAILGASHPQQTTPSVDVIRSFVNSVVFRELRNSVSLIHGLGEILENCQLDAVAARLALQTRCTASRLKDLLLALSDLACLSEAGLALSLETFSISRLVRGQIEAIAATNEWGAAKRLAVEFDPDLPTLVIGFREKVSQLNLKIVHNALKYGGDAPVIVKVRIVERREGAVTVEFSVRDQGVGIHPDHLKRVFEPFFRADLPGDLNDTGIGLGLFVCQLLVKDMGGSITIESEVNKGTVVCAQIPFETVCNLSESTTFNDDTF